MGWLVTLYIISYITSFILSILYWKKCEKFSVLVRDVIAFSIVSLLGPINILIVLCFIIGHFISKRIDFDRKVW